MTNGDTFLLYVSFHPILTSLPGQIYSNLAKRLKDHKNGLFIYLFIYDSKD